MNDRTRKTLIRAIGAPLLLAALAGLLYLDHVRNSVVGLRFFIAIVIGLAAWEFFALCRKKGHDTAAVAGLLAAALPALPWLQLRLWLGRGTPPSAVTEMTAYWTHAHMALVFLPLLLLALYLLFKLVFRWGFFTVEEAALTLLGTFYVGLLHFAYPPHTPNRIGVTDATWYLVFMIATNKGSDMAAFVVGKLFGRRKMSPVLSPNKTWEGAIAGGIAGTGAGFLALWLSPLTNSTDGAYRHVSAVCLLLFALLVTIASQVGDLAESAFKRWAGVKDSGGLLPEFGGILDMADSFILSLPVAWFLSEFLFRVF